MVIDANMYWIPEALFTDAALQKEFLDELNAEDNPSGYCGHLAQAAPGTQQFVIEKPKGFQNVNCVQHEYELPRQLADMDAAGVDRGVLKVPCCQEWMGLEMCRKFNDGMAAQAAASNGRLAALAVLPPEATEACFAELDRCIDELGMHGVQLSAHYGGKYLDDESFAPFFARLNEKALTVYIHHTPLPVQYDSLLDYNSLRRSYGRCVDQTTAVCRELYSDMFSRFPNLKFVHSMLGGGFFALAPMMIPHAPAKQDTVSRFSSGGENVAKHLKENIFFELSHAQPWGKAQLECAVAVLGADHLVYGSSYPVRMEWQQGGPDFVRQLDISEEAKDAILYKNAERLYHFS